MTVLYVGKEAAKRLGVSYDTYKKMKEAGDIKTIKVGKREKVSEDEIRRLLSSGNRDKKIIDFTTRLLEKGYSASQTADIMGIFSEVL